MPELPDIHRTMRKARGEQPLPCPFCGSDAIIYKDPEIEEWFVECKDANDPPDGCIPNIHFFGGPFPSARAAATAWNIRRFPRKAEGGNDA